MQLLRKLRSEGYSDRSMVGDHDDTMHRPRTLNECGFQSKFGMIRHLTDGLAWALKKGVASCDMLRVAACRLRSGDTRMGLPAAGDTCGAPIWSGNLPNGSIQVGRGRETKWYSLSSSERRGRSSNRTCIGNYAGMWGYRARPHPRLRS